MPFNCNRNGLPASSLIVGVRLTHLGYFEVSFQRDQPLPHTFEDGLGAVGLVEFAENVFNVGANGFFADVELLSDGAIGGAGGHALQNSQFTRG